MNKKALIVMVLYVFVLIFAACSDEVNNVSTESSDDDIFNTEESSQNETTNGSEEVELSGIDSSENTTSDNLSTESDANSSNNTNSEESDSSNISSENTSIPDNSNTSSTDISTVNTSDVEISDVETSEPEPPVLHAIDVPKVYITVQDQINVDDYIDAVLKISDPEGIFSEITDDKGLIRVRGNSTSSGDKKPYNIKFDSKKTVLGLGTAKKWCLLANMYDKTLIRNKLSYDFATEIGMQYVSNSTFVDVYVNGRYMGNYLLTEAVAAGDTRVEIDTDENEFLLEYEPWEGYNNPENIRTPIYGILFGFNDPEEPTTAQRNYLNNFFANAETALSSRNLNSVKNYFDLPSMVDFYIVNEYFKNVDFATSSTRFYIKDGKIYGGPVWDLDLSTGNCSSTYYHEYNNVGGSGDSTESFYCDKLWYRYLFECDGFLDMVKARYLELQPYIINLTTDNALGKNKIDILLIKYRNSFDDNYILAGWSMTKKNSDYERIPFNTYDKNLLYLRQWLIERNEWLLEEWDLK